MNSLNLISFSGIKNNYNKPQAQYSSTPAFQLNKMSGDTVSFSGKFWDKLTGKKEEKPYVPSFDPVWYDQRDQIGGADKESPLAELLRSQKYEGNVDGQYFPKYSEETIADIVTKVKWGEMTEEDAIKQYCS